MVASVTREQTSRLISAITNANAAKRETELRPLAPLFMELASKLGAILQSFTAGPVKCSVSGLDVEILKPDDVQVHGTAFESKNEEIGVRFRAERSFDSIICEICFGGSGAPKDEGEDSDRPPSRIETLLRNMVFDSLHDSIPDVFKNVSDTVLRPVEMNTAAAKLGESKPVPFLRASILINVFSMSAEMEVLLPLRQLESLMGALGVLQPTDHGNVAAVLGKCPFEVKVALPPHRLGLREILSLSVGSMLKLETRPSDPSLLSVAGVVVGKCRLDISSSQLGVVLM